MSMKLTSTVVSQPSVICLTPYLSIAALNIDNAPALTAGSGPGATSSTHTESPSFSISPAMVANRCVTTKASGSGPSFGATPGDAQPPSAKRTESPQTQKEFRYAT
jgi:hypothetical protein